MALLALLALLRWLYILALLYDLRESKNKKYYVFSFLTNYFLLFWKN